MTVKRGRGRPRKRPPEPTAAEAIASPPVKRGRGRPRKNQNASEVKEKGAPLVVGSLEG